MLPASRGIRQLGRLSDDVASSETLSLEESDAKGWYINMSKVGQGGKRAENGWRREHNPGSRLETTGKRGWMHVNT